MPAPTVIGQHEARYIAEATEGAGVPSTGSLAIPSDAIRSVKLRARGNRSKLRDIGNANKAVDTISGTKEYELEIMFSWQDVGATWTALQDWLARAADGRLKTYAWEIASATDATTKAYYTFKGCKAEEVELTFDEDGVLVWRVLFFALDVATATAQPVLPGTTTRQSAANGTTYFVWTGGKVEDGSAAALAYATTASVVLVKHNLKAVKDIGGSIVKTHLEGHRDINWKGTVTADDGGKALFDATSNGTEINVVVKSSTTAGKPKLTLVNTDIGEIEYAPDTENQVVSYDLDRPAEDLTIGTV